MKTYALCDVNSFYVSCERLFRPDLNGRPVVVLSNNDGCIISISDEAKAAGIRMAVPYHEVRNIIRRHKIVAFSSNYGLYGDMSQRFNWLLEQHCDQVASYSVDESFMCFEGYEQDVTDIGRSIRRDLWHKLSLPVCVGFGPSKTLAKVANHFAKKNKTMTKGVVDLTDPELREAVLKQVPVRKIWGIGSRLAQALVDRRIYTAWDLHNADFKVLRRIFSVNMERMIQELRGQPCLSFEQVPPAKKSILNSRTFGRGITDYKDVKEALAYHATRCCEKLRKQASMASAITLYLYGRKDKNNYYYRPHQTVVLPEASDDTGIFVQAVEKGLQHMYRSGQEYKKAGIMLTGLVSRNGYQPDLFHHVQSRPKLMSSVDRINTRFGKDMVKFASLGFQKKWAMRANSKSPMYTSRWSDILRID